jgi:hypothetical protein
MSGFQSQDEKGPIAVLERPLVASSMNDKNRSQYLFDMAERALFHPGPLEFC